MAADKPSDPNPLAPAAPSGDRLQNLTAPQRQVAYAPAYSRLVRRLRVILPLIAVFTIATIILWPRIWALINRPTATSTEERQAKMVNGRYVGSDSHGRPYTVTYDSAQQAPGGGPITMTNPLAELTLENGHWLALRAEKGRYDQAAGLIDLSGHVELFHDEGYRFTTERAHVELSKNLIWGDRAVEGRGPKGELIGRGFRVINNGDSIVLTGPAKLVLRPDAAEMPQPEQKK